jgi:hypothetical protein
MPKELPSCDHAICKHEDGAAAMTDEEIRFALECLVEKGVIDLVGFDKDGEPVYQMNKDYL